MALRFMILVAGVGTFTLMGCGETGPPTFPVTGTVTMGGSPVEGAVVTFTSSGGGACVGVTDVSGKYELTTKSKGDGAVVGKYKVTIAKYDGPTDQGTQAAPSDVDVTSEDFDEYASVEGYDEGEGEGEAPSKNLLPEKYASADSSGFEADVVAGDNSFDFALEGAGGAAPPAEGEGEGEAKEG